MLEIESIGEMIKEREKLDGKSVGLVPTMGYLHEGHLSLVEAAKRECDVVVMSIFVNPLQFGPEEDFDRYPRDLERDQRLAREHGVDILFVPQAEEMYPKKPAATVKVTGITEVLCGKSRPGHFDGVATVVMKLFQLVRPRRAYFGQKDAQQVAVIHRMAEDLNVPVEIVACPIVREKDGLAMSSRNVYLTEEERAQAVILNRTLQHTRDGILLKGWKNVEDINAFMRKSIESMPLASLDYAEVLTYPDLKKHDRIREGSYILAAAVYFGSTRLIDNVIIQVEGS